MNLFCLGQSEVDQGSGKTQDGGRLTGIQKKHYIQRMYIYIYCIYNNIYHIYYTYSIPLFYRILENCLID